ncbi:MAG TPA: hypothetical protein QGH10_02390, partial [Armatimonadota bacterium]|nr:hypothetical protein [Armatimonadota bacterium]
AYVAEELLGQPIDKTGYVLGATLPAKGPEREDVLPGSIPDVVLRDGKPADDIESCMDAFKVMGPDDVIIKGGNALDYPSGLAGVLVGHPEGGTVGAMIGHVYGRKVNVVIPIGLEKQTATSLEVAQTELLEATGSDDTPTLWVFDGDIITELEAIELLADVDAMQIGAGGIAGAQGAVWLTAVGTDAAVAAAAEIIQGIQGEPPFASV